MRVQNQGLHFLDIPKSPNLDFFARCVLEFMDFFMRRFLEIVDFFILKTRIWKSKIKDLIVEI